MNPKVKNYLGVFGVVAICGAVYGNLGFQGGVETEKARNPRVYTMNVYGDERPEIVVDNGKRKIVYFEESGKYKPLVEHLESQKESEIINLEKKLEEMKKVLDVKIEENFTRGQQH
jgi:hypothetical protein